MNDRLTWFTPVAIAICTTLGGLSAACGAAGSRDGDSGNPAGGSNGSNSSHGGKGAFVGAGGGPMLNIEDPGATGNGSQGLSDAWQYYGLGDEFGYKDSSLPDDVKDKFEGSPTGGGQIVYPLDNSMHPLNILDLTFQWQGVTGDFYRIQGKTNEKTYNFFVLCKPKNGGCVYQMPAKEWSDIARSNAGKAVEFTLSAATADGVMTTPKVLITFSPSAVNGALYYWAAGSASVKRASFGAPRAVPFISPKSSTNEFACTSCHSLSRDGKTIAFAVAGVGGQNIAGIQVAPTADPTNPYLRPSIGNSPYPADLLDLSQPGATISEQATSNFGSNIALNADGTLAAVQMLDTARQIAFEIRDARSGATTFSLNPYATATPDVQRALCGTAGSCAVPYPFWPLYPEWSPDGKSIAVQLAQGCVWSLTGCKSGIATLAIDGKTVATGGYKSLVTKPAVGFHFYPTWSPDQKWVAFASALSDVDPTRPDLSHNLGWTSGVLRMVPASGGPYECPGPSCVELVNGTQYTAADVAAGRGMHSTWPKFAPFSQGVDGNIMWISFSSRIPYGLESDDTSRLWMFAIDISKVGSGDPSFAPFWIPFQDDGDGSAESTGHNLTPYWTTELPCQILDEEAGTCLGCVEGEMCQLNKELNTCDCKSPKTVVR